MGVNVSQTSDAHGNALTNPAVTTINAIRKQPFLIALLQVLPFPLSSPATPPLLSVPFRLGPPDLQRWDLFRKMADETQTRAEKDALLGLMTAGLVGSRRCGSAFLSVVFTGWISIFDGPRKRDC